MRVQGQKNTSTVQIFARYFLLSFLVFALDGIGVLGIPKKFSESLISISTRAINPIVNLVVTPINYLKSGHNADQKIRNLEQRLAESLVTKAELQALQVENEDLRNLLEAPLSPSWNYIVAPVLARKDGELQIGLGKADKIQVNDIVVYEENFVGSVSLVSEKMSTVKTLKNSKTRFRAKVVNQPTDGIVFVEEGKLFFGEVLQSAQLSVGDIIETSGGDGVFAEIVVGVVSSIEEDSDGIHVLALIDPAVDPKQLQTIFVVAR